MVDYAETLRKTAAATRDTGKPPDTSLLKTATTGLTGTYGQVGKAAVQQFEQEAAAQPKRAEKAASALEMVGESTLQGVQNIENIQSQVRGQVNSASESWGAAAEKADEYVQAARGRVGQVLEKLDEINDGFAKERSFAKAHAMQASVQAVVGSMKTEERNIVETYGIASPEYNQFRQSKQTALATVQSNIHASYQQLAEEQNKTYLMATQDAYTKSNMYLGFQEQQHVEMLKYSDQSKANYALQASQLDASLEQMKMSGMENLANWIIETPSFTMDMTPVLTLLSDLQTTQETMAQAGDLSKAQTALTSAEAQKNQTWADYLSGKRGSVYKQTGRGR